MTKTDLILSLIQIIEPKTERDAVIKAAVIQLITPDEFPAKPAEPMQDEPKPDEIKTYYKKRIKIDVGKLGALRRAGWSVTKIADEFGVSAPTIRNYMKREGIQ